MPKAFAKRLTQGLALALAIGAAVGLTARGAQAIEFNRDIRPILSEHCFQCHGPDPAHRAADLQLDDEQAAKADRGGYRAVDVSQPDQSELLARVTSDDPDIVMPPPHVHKELSREQIGLLREWIEQGAPWSQPWAYVPPKRSTPPAFEADRWSSNWIDNFVLHRIKREGFSPSPVADAVTLVRRLSLDLTGLPPSPGRVESFVAQPTFEAYERLVDELLASPHFGERMAVYWLDLVRYADTVGYHGDQEHHIWQYRDYVIHAFNENKPFDDFTREQLAGDLLPGATVDDVIASAYNRLLQTSHEGGVQLKEYRSIYLADRVRNVSQVWMGATMGCAQCHDHKFDPLTAREFYSLGAFFADIDDENHLRNQFDGTRNFSPTPREPMTPVLSVYQRERIAEIDDQLESLDAEANRERVASLRAERDAIADAIAPLMISRASKPRAVRVLPRGNWQDESGEVVDPQTPAALGLIDVGGRRATRLDLAEWLTAEDGAGGLTARVMANRLWYLMFGRGIAEVLDDFGGQGQPPTHPELLDNLAVEFMESGWDIKHMMKLTAMSRAYRQSSVGDRDARERDPANRFFARQARYRLPAEGVRDACLSISGLLVNEIGGPSVRPYQPKGLYKHLNYPKRVYQHDTDERQWRRGLYVHWQRQYLHPMMKAFDAPSREECVAQRPRSNSPLSALALLNDPTFVEAARNFAASTLSESADGAEQRIDRLYRRAVSRPPDDYERAQLIAFAESQLDYYRNQPQEAEQLAGVGQSPQPEGIDAVELAAWTSVARAVLNLSETLSRN